MLDKEKIFTGFHSVTGEKIYLGDKIRQFIVGDMSTAFVVMYDDSEQNYAMIPIGRNSKNGLYRKYPLKGNLDSPHSKFHVAGNVVFSNTPNIGDKVKIIVTNKGENFPFGSFAEVLSMGEWAIRLKSPLADDEKEFQFGEFMENRI